MFLSTIHWSYIWIKFDSAGSASFPSESLLGFFLQSHHRVLGHQISVRLLRWILQLLNTLFQRLWNWGLVKTVQLVLQSGLLCTWKNKWYGIYVNWITHLTLSWRRPLSYRNQFLYDNGLCHERVKREIPLNFFSVRDHSISVDAKFSEKLTFLTSW